MKEEMKIKMSKEEEEEEEGGFENGAIFIVWINPPVIYDEDHCYLNLV